MSAENTTPDRTTAILEWQKKHGIQDGDPLLVSLELWDIFFSSIRKDAEADAHSQITSVMFEEFRSSIQQLDRISKSFGSQTAELIQEIRAVPKIRDDLNSFPVFAMIFSAAIALVTGILVGKFIL